MGARKLLVTLNVVLRDERLGLATKSGRPRPFLRRLRQRRGGNHGRHYPRRRTSERRRRLRPTAGKWVEVTPAPRRSLRTVCVIIIGGAHAWRATGSILSGGRLTFVSQCYRSNERHVTT
jgi:hypothetical protein